MRIITISIKMAHGNLHDGSKKLSYMMGRKSSCMASYATGQKIVREVIWLIKKLLFAEIGR